MFCPVPITDYQHITLAHGGGGKLMQDLLQKVIFPGLGVDASNWHDAAKLAPSDRALAFTTDSYVIQPRQFPGGDIGKLSVCGTANDLAMLAAKPQSLSVSLILEEGLAIEELWLYLNSIRATAEGAGIDIVTGDTKVVRHGEADGIYINTAGIGVVQLEDVPSAQRVEAGDVLIVSGDVGRHGMAVMAARDQLAFTAEIESCVAVVWPQIQVLIDAGVSCHWLRDITRGGLASVANELAASSGLSVRLEEAAIPVQTQVASLCDLLGFDPLYVACEGRFVAVVPEQEAQRAVSALQAFSGLPVAIIGEIEPLADSGVPVKIRNAYGVERVLHLLAGEQLPRIC